MKNWKAKTIIAGTILLLIVASVYYYIALPAINIHSPGFWKFIIVVLVAAMIIYLLFQTRFTQSAGSGYFSADRFGIEFKTPQSAKIFKIMAAVCIVVAAVFAIGSLLSSKIINASKYQKLLDVETRSFKDDIKEVSYDQIPILDKDSAETIGNRVMGTMVDLVSQFEVNDMYTQINYKNKPVRVSPLQYGSLIKWLTNKSDGIPGYIRIDMTTQQAEVVRLEKGIRYSTSDHFGRNIYRHLRFAYPTYMFDDIRFEIDDDVSEVPQWVDKVYSADMLINLYDYYGTLKHGFLNSVLRQKDCVKTTDGYNYIALDDDVWVYTGITSVGQDKSNVGFVLMNQRTMETRYYEISGAEENSAMSSAEGKVQHLNYTATFPLLLNVGGEPTYFMALKDSAGLVKSYAMLNIEKYQNVAIGETVSECEANYIKMMSQSGVITQEKQEEKNISGTITKIIQTVVDGNSHFYITIDSSDAIFDVNVIENPEIIKYNVGDVIKLSYTENDKTNDAKPVK